MDRKIEKKKWSLKKSIYLIGAIAIIILSIWGFNSINNKSYDLDASKITIKEASKANFQDIILIDGLIEPITSVFINSPEGGTVEEVFVEDGAIVNKGTPLMRLRNPSVMLGYLTQETAIVEQMNNLQNLKLSLNKDQRDLVESLIDVEYLVSDKERIFSVDTILVNDGIISKNEFTNSKEEYKYQLKKRDFLNENVSKTKVDNAQQIERINRSLEMMERNLDFIHASMQKLLIRASVSGRLSSFDPVIGQSFPANQNIGKIDVLQGYKVKGSVDEFYLSTVKAGQKARFSFDGEIIELKVKKVLPEVVNGRFEIDLIFLNETPEAIRTGLSMQVRLELSKASDAILIPRESYFHSSGGQYVFVVNENNEAIKRTIKIGRQNPSFYEVLEGLDQGESIITSSYEAYSEYDKINLIK